MAINAPTQWKLYLIPDLKTWSTDTPNQTPIETYNTFAEVKQRFNALRSQPYNREANDLNPNGEPYARLTLGIESHDGRDAVDILQVRGDQNTLITDFSTLKQTRQNAEVLRLVARIADEFGFDRVMTCAPEKVNGVWPMVILPFEEWNSPHFMEIAPASWFEKQEARFMESDNAYAIYQLKDGDELHNLRFESYEHAKSAIDKSNYRIVYTGELSKDCALPRQLDVLFQRFNMDYPQDYHGRSMSVSDVIAVKQNGKASAHYVDSIGFAELPGFLPPDNPLKNAEMAMEDDYGMIDGIINNGKSPAMKMDDPSKRPIEKPPSILEQLRADKAAMRAQPRRASKPPVKGADIER